LSVASTDDLGASVRALVPREVAPNLHALATRDHRFYHVETPVAVQLDDAISAHGALWPAIEAVARVHASWAVPAIIEGWALLPDLVAGSFARSAVWLTVPASVFLQRVWTDRTFLAGAPDPDVLASRFAERSAAFSFALQASVRRLRLPFLELQGTQTPAEIAETILTALAETAAQHAAAADERRARGGRVR
jgi:hypothetical protein